MYTHAVPRPQTTNRILNALTPFEFESLSRHLEPVSLCSGEVLCRPEQPVTHVYFPTRGTVSLISSFEDGDTVEVGMVGNEGMFGVSVFLGSVTTPLWAQVQLPGKGLRMRADVLRGEFRKGGQLQDLLLRYTQAFITQIAQTAACYRAHKLEGRLAKWLLMCADRSQSEELSLTHEFIATMLGTRRPGVTETACQLKETGLINYKRGSVKIVDRAGLEAVSCECYPLVKKEFTRIIGADSPTYHDAVRGELAPTQ